MTSTHSAVQPNRRDTYCNLTHYVKSTRDEESGAFENSLAIAMTVIY